jgi:hypothetical protein
LNKIGNDSQKLIVPGSEVDKYKCNIENLLELKRNIIIKVSSSLFPDENMIEVLFIN